MKSYQVIRTHTSPYQRGNFLAEEKKMVESFPELAYRDLHSADDSELILITNTHTQLSALPKKILGNARLIIHPNSGYDHFSTEHELWRDVPLVIGHKIRAQAVAEYSLAALFQGKVELPQHLIWDKDRKWTRTLLKDSP
jgi:lactate dehydrogenase-like 2-hydroxyacid dehydrogenase